MPKHDPRDADAPDSIGHSASVSDVLTAAGEVDGPLGSGAATALSLSLAVECLTLHWALSRRTRGSKEREVWLNGLSERLEAWRKTCREAFVADQTHFGEVIAARRAQTPIEGEGRRRLAERELLHLASANDVLVTLMNVAEEVGRDAGVMVETHGSRVGEGEGATAGYLAAAVRDSAATMLASNIRSAANRCEALGVVLPRRAAVAGVARRLPAGRPRDVLEAQLERLDAAAGGPDRG